MIKKLLLPLLYFIALHSWASPQLMPLESYAQEPAVSLMTISPDGSRIAYKLIQGERELLVVQDINSGKYLGGIEIGSIDPKNSYFIDNNRVILKASEYKYLAAYGGYTNISSAFVFDIESKEVRQLLIPGYGIYKGQTGLGSIIGLSPDKDTAYMPSFYLDEGGYLGRSAYANTPPIYTLMKVSLTKKKKPRQVRIGSHHAVDFFVNESGEPIARELFNESKNQHKVQSFIDDEWVDIFTQNTPIRYKSFVGLTPDRKSIVMITTGQNNRQSYYTMSLADGTISDAIFSRDDADVEQVLTDIQRVVYGVRYSGFKPSYEFFDQVLTKNFNTIQKALPNNSVKLIDHTPDWSKIIFKIEGDNQPGDYLLFANNTFEFLTASRPQVLPEQVSFIKEYSYLARDGLNIPTLLTYPQGGDKKNLPAVIFPHGGPASYDRIGFDWIAQYLSSRGILVIQPQFRGSKGFGAAHSLKGRGEWGKKMQDDLTDAVIALNKEGLIDPKRVCIIGASYGGYAALAGATFTPDIYKCAISINGLSDLNSMFNQERKDHGRNSEELAYWKEVITKNNLNKEFLNAISPINAVDKVKIPLLLIHGERDDVVNIDQSEDFYDELKDANKEVKFVKLAEEGHYLLQEKSKVSILKALEKFLKPHLL